MSDRLFTSSPSDATSDWYVWDIYEPLPPKPVFVGNMEDAGLVADALNARLTLHPVPYRRDE
jgi:hypothetical protein